MTATESTAPPTKGLVLRAAQARWYDLLAAVLTLGRERELRERLAKLARLAPGESVLDVGCGTGTLALAAKRAVGATGTVTGIDASPDMIALATRKAARAGADVRFRNATAEQLPMSDETFDAVLATLMLHHLPAPVRRECAREVFRVLKPGGRMLAVDFAAPSARKGGLLARFHRHGGLPLDAVSVLLRDAGFDVSESGAVGMSDLYYVLAMKPRLDQTPLSVGDVAAERPLAPLGRPRWIAPAVVGIIAVAHLLMAHQLVTHITLSVTGLVIALAGGIVVWLHLAPRR